jgi:iron complex transport system substrate-binding protein
MKRSIYEIDLTSFKKANPDLIFTQELCDVCAVDYGEVVEASKTLPQKPKIVSLTPSLLSDVLQNIRLVGEATGKTKDAEALVTNLERRIEQVREQAARSDQRPRVACLEWLEPIYGAGHWVPELVQWAGGREGLVEKGQPSPKIQWNKVVQFAPEVVVLMPCGFDVKRTLKEIHLLYKLPGWKDLPAVKKEQVFAVNGHAYFNRSGPRLVEGLELLGQIIHPEIFPWKASPDAARKIEAS